MHTERFDDFDEFAAGVRGIDATMLLQNPTRFSWEIDSAVVSGLRVQRGRLGSGNIVEGRSWEDGVLLYLPLSDTCEYHANGTTIGMHAFAILEPGCEFCVSTKLEHDWATIFVPSHVFELDPDFEGEPVGVGDGICRVTRPSRMLANQFRIGVSDVLAVSDLDPQFESSLGSSVAAAALLELATRILGKNQVRALEHSGRPKIPREEIIRRARLLLEEREGQYVSVTDLATSAEVSDRTLRSAFQETVGVGPARYLQLRNLHRIRRALAAADPEETTVAELLAAHGEWQFGRCAARYKSLFGELPSETLHGKAR